jgi:hypothetical protein
MAYTYEELKNKTVAELREIAKGIDHEAVQGATQMNKEHLLDAMCVALNLDKHVHQQATGIDKTSVKSRIRELKQRRDSAVASHDSKQLSIVRRRIHRLKRRITKATVKV